MVKKLITEKGKDEILKLAFGLRNLNSAFSCMALGRGEGEYNQSSMKLLEEVSGYNYNRIVLDFPESENNIEKRIGAIAMVDNSNIDVEIGQEIPITEIGIVNSIEPNVENEIFLCMSKMPTVEKNRDIAVQYAVIVEIE